MAGERFIPFRKSDVVTMCVDEVPSAEQAPFRSFVELLESLLHQEFRGRLEALKDAYCPFNPDADVRTVREPSAAERDAAKHRLVEELSALAEAANFEQISADDLDRAFVEESLVKVRLEADFGDFEQVVFYRRGVHTREEEVKRWFGLRRTNITFTNYGKVLVYVKFKDAAHFQALGKKVDDLPFAPDSMIIKLFQDVPRADLEMLFPNARVRMRAIDKLLIGVPAVVSGIIWWSRSSSRRCCPCCCCWRSGSGCAASRSSSTRASSSRSVRPWPRSAASWCASSASSRTARSSL
jgi:Protein of unknown function (DUF3754)